MYRFFNTGILEMGRGCCNFAVRKSCGLRCGKIWLLATTRKNAKIAPDASLAGLLSRRRLFELYISPHGGCAAFARLIFFMYNTQRENQI